SKSVAATIFFPPWTTSPSTNISRLAPAAKDRCPKSRRPIRLSPEQWIASSAGPIVYSRAERRLMNQMKYRHPGEGRYRIHTSLARHASAKHRPYTSRPRSGEREGPIAKQWEGEGRPCYLFLRCAAQPDCRHFHEPPLGLPERCTKGPGAPHPPNADALGPSLSPLSRGEVYRRSPNSPAKMCAYDSGFRRDDGRRMDLSGHSIVKKQNTKQVSPANEWESK